MIAAEAQKSFKKIASTQLPQQEVKGAWFEQLASEQQLIFSSLSISLGNFMVKYAAFKKKEELYQSSFSESSFSESSFSENMLKSAAFKKKEELYQCSLSASILQTSLATSMQWPSLCRRSSTRMMEHQLPLQEPACGSHDPRAGTGACKRACRHGSSLLSSKQKKQEEQLDKELLQREFRSFSFTRTFWQNGLQLSQLAEGRSHHRFRHLALQEQLQASSFLESSLHPAACQQSSLTAIAFSSFLLRSSFEQL